VILSLIAAGCSSSPVGIPETLELHIDKNLTFTEVLASPESYKGRLILLGGEVLKAKRLKEGTQVELLQLPLNNDQEPTIDLTQSQGRVLVLHQEFLDPATLMPGMLVTFGRGQRGHCREDGRSRLSLSHPNGETLACLDSCHL